MSPASASFLDSPIHELLRDSDTSRIRAEGGSLYRSHLAAIIDSAMDGIITLDAAHHVLVFNAAAERMFGLPAGQVIGRSIERLLPVRVRQLHDTHLRRFAGEGATNRAMGPLGEVSGLRADGSEFPIEASISTISVAGQLLFTIILRDISERRRMDENLRVAAIAFESQEALLVTDAQAQILRVNEAFVRATGYAPQEVIGRNLRMLQSGHHPPAFYVEMWRQILANGRWMGEIWDKRKNGEIYPKWMSISCVKNEAGEVTHYVGSFTDISTRKEAIETISQLAYYDTLTGLPNRALMMDRLAQALAVTARSGDYGAVLFVDLDHFKTVNDTLGHKEGDKLLQEAGRRLRAALREEDTVARFGGDEFVILLQDLGAKREQAAIRTKSIADKMLVALSQPYFLANAECASSASIGAALWRGSLKVNPNDLLKRSDLAMYESKKSGRNTLRFFDPLMQTTIERRVNMERDLRDAIRKDQFVLHYQAQVDGDRRVTGAEALVRWQHPDHRLVSPDEFVSLAEETGMILPLGNWVLEAACAQLSAWSARPETAHLDLAVNISGHQIHQPGFVDQVLQILERTGANPHLLKLELTESVLMRDVDTMIGRMAALRERGVHFALDDFGTGYSSLSQLKRLPLKCLKIDRSFITDVLTNPSDAAITRTIMGLAANLGLSVIAEGVETEEQRAYLARNGCTQFQGYLFSRPLALHDFESFAAGTQA